MFEKAEQEFQELKKKKEIIEHDKQKIEQVRASASCRCTELQIC